MKLCRHVITIGGVLLFGCLSLSVRANDCCTSYRVVYKTVYDEERVTAYRLVYETEVEHRKVTTMKPEWVNEPRQRTIRVAKPVLETSTRNEVRRVMRPVIETETRYQSHVVRKAVTETVMQDRNYVTCEPVCTMKTEYVDQGRYVDQVVQTPGTVRNRLQWLPGAYFVDPRTQTQVYHRGGLHWVPTQQPGSCTVCRQYVPCIVERQVAQTSYVQKVVTQQVPCQVTRYVDEVVQQPVQCQVQKWVTEEINCPITVTTQRIQYEDRVEDYTVQKCNWVAEEKTIACPHTVAKWQPYVCTRLVPRCVAIQVPCNPCDPCCTSTITSYPPAAAPATSTQKVPAGSSVIKDEKKPVTPAAPTPAAPTPAAPAKSTSPETPTPTAPETSPPAASDNNTGSANDADPTGKPSLPKSEPDFGAPA